MKPNYEEMVEKAIAHIKVKISNEDKGSLVSLLNTTNTLVELLNDGKEDHGLRSTQVIAHIISSYLMELYVAGKISFEQ